MSRNKKIVRLKEVFDDEEIFCPHILKKFGSSAWNYLSNGFIDTLYHFRFILFKVPIYINHPSQGKTERGIRCNLCKITKAYTERGESYMTAHFLDGCDINVQGMSAAHSRDLIRADKDNLPHPLRLESDVPWVHWDVRNYADCKINEF